MLTLYAHLGHFSGVARHASGFAQAVSKQVDLAWVPIDANNQSLPKTWREWLHNGETPHSPSVGVGIGAPDIMPRVQGCTRIGWVVWESSRMPSSRIQHLQHLDEIWTPTRWGRQILIDSGLSSVPIRVVPEGADPEVFRPIQREDPSGSPERPFRFLCVGKWEPRKGFDLLLRAWSQAFEADDPVELILHTYDAQDRSWTLENALAQLDLPPHAPVIWSRPASLLSLVLLYNRCDVFVTATRGEGWGLPIFEALACAKPVIAPAFGALGELLDDQFAYLVEVDSSPAAYGWSQDPQDDYGSWGEPRVDHLATLMQQALANPERGIALGKAGRRAVLERWTWDRSAEIALAGIDAFETGES